VSIAQVIFLLEHRQTESNRCNWSTYSHLGYHWRG